jgi:single-strand DNA-binding protein
MRGVNKMILMGHLGTDPEVRYTVDGRSVVSLSVATTSNWKDGTTGEMQQETEWHRVVLFNRLAQIAEEYLKKGALVYIEGSLQTNRWKDASGADRSTTQIVGKQLEMLGGKEPSTAPSEQMPDLDIDLPF